MADGRELGVNDVIVSRVHDEEPLHRPPSVSRFDSCAGAPPPESLSAWANDLSASDDRRLTVLHIGTLNKQIGTNLGYSPIETVIDNVHRGLRAGGHRSIVACSADSRFAGERHATVSRSLGDYVRDDTVERRDMVRRHLSSAFDRAAMGDVDVIHMHEHVGHAYEAYEAGYSPVAPVVMTLHVKAAESGLRQARHACSNALAKQSVYFVAISDDQSADYAPIVAPWATVHHGIDVNDFPIKTTPSSDGYLLMIGRVTRDKGQHRAIELAKRTGSTLVIAGCVQNKPDDAAFFDSIKGSIDAFVDVNRHPAGPDYFERVIQPVAGLRPPDHLHRRGRRRPEEALLPACPGDALPHSVAGALRTGADRIHGLRHARTGLQPGALSPRSWPPAARVSSSTPWTRWLRPRRSSPASTRGFVVGTWRPSFPPVGWRADIRRSTGTSSENMSVMGRLCRTGRSSRCVHS